jgi:hypothetical protein
VLKHDVDRLQSRASLNIHLPDLKNFSVPIRIAKMPLVATLNQRDEENKPADPFEELSDDDDEQKENEKNRNEGIRRPIAEKKKTKSEFDLLKIFTLNHPPKKVFPLETNSSTLAFSDTHLLLHDQKKLLLFTVDRRVNETPWNDNEAGLSPLSNEWVNESLVKVFSWTCVGWTPSTRLSFSPSTRSICSTRSNVARRRSTRSVRWTEAPFGRRCVRSTKICSSTHTKEFTSTITDCRRERTTNGRFSQSKCAEKSDLGIRDVRSDGEYLCLSFLQGEDLRWRLDLVSEEMVRVRRGVQMDSAENQHKFFSMLIPLNDQRWIFVNWFTNQLWIVDHQGKTRQVKEAKMKNIRNIVMSTDSTHLVVRTDKPALLQIFNLE